MRRSGAVLFSLALLATPAFAADVAESYYGRETVIRPKVERHVVIEEPSELYVEEEPVIEERVIVRRPRPVVVRRTYVEEGPDYHFRRFHPKRRGYEHGYFGGREWRGGW